MVWNLSYWLKVGQRILYVILLLIGLYLGIKLSIFYMPFLVAFIISLMIEPAIKKIMKKTGATRRTSSIIIFIIVSIVILGSLAWLIITIFSEASSLLQTLNDYFDKAYNQFNELVSTFNFNKIHLSKEILPLIENSTNDIFQNVSTWVRNSLTSLLDLATRLPSIVICIGITVIALYFICVDKIYILDQIEYHLPKMWVKKITSHLKDLIQTLGGYLKAETTLILVSFIICLVGLYILKCTGFNVQYPLLMALVIGFVDALPILGSGSFMIPWAIICAINGDLNLGIAIIILLIIMSTSRQILEPKLISKNIGVHPIFTLIAMYTGFKVIGIMGLLVGPIVLIIFKNIFSNLIDRGVFKTIFDKR